MPQNETERELRPGDDIKLDNDFAVILLPKNAVEVSLIVTVYYNGDLMKVNRVLDMDEVKTAFKKAADGYIDEEDRFQLSENGLRYLEELDNKTYSF